MDYGLRNPGRQKPRTSGILPPLARRRHMKRATTNLILTCLAVAGCSSSGNDETLQITYISGFNFVVDSPTMEFKVGADNYAVLPYLSGRAIFPISTGDYDLTFTAFVPTPLGDPSFSTIPVGTTIPVTLALDDQNIVVAYGSVNQLQTLIVNRIDLFDTLAPDTVRIQFIHVATSVADIDVEFDAMNDGGSETRMLGTVAPGTTLDPVTLVIPDEDVDGDGVTDDPGRLTLDIRLTEPGNMTPTYISVPITVFEGGNLIFAISDSLAAEVSPLKLFAFGTDGATLGFEAAGTNTNIRLVHVSPDTGDLDMYDSTDLMTPVLEDVSFLSVSPFAPFAPGDYDLTFTPANDPMTVLFEELVTGLQTNTITSIYAFGLMADIDGFQAFDDARGVATDTRFRFSIFAPSLAGASRVDVYLTEAGVPIDFGTTQAISNNIPYGIITNYNAQLSDDYDLTFVEDGTDVILAGPLTRTFAAGDVTMFVLTENPVGTYVILPVAEVFP